MPIGCRLFLEAALQDSIADDEGLVRVPVELDGQPAYVTFTADHHWPFVELCRLTLRQVETRAGHPAT